MSHDFELKRLTEKIHDLHKEQEQLTHSLMRARRDEQYELERVRREFNVRVNMMETRQEGIQKDLRDYERKYEALQRQMLQEVKSGEEDDGNHGRSIHLHRRLR